MEANNHTTVVEAYEPGFQPPDLMADMEAYDALPIEVRRAIDAAPFMISTRAALERLDEKGLDYLLAEIAGDCVDYHRSCAQETGIPAPIKPLGSGRKRCRRR